jgi:predicted Zn-dependent protease
VLDSIRVLFKRLAPAVDFCSLRVVDESSETIVVRQDVLQPLSSHINRGAMVTVLHGGGYGYAATSDLTASGLKVAFDRAKSWAIVCSKHPVMDFSKIVMPSYIGNNLSPDSNRTAQPFWRDIINHLQAESVTCRIDSRIVDWEASVWTTNTNQLYLTSDGCDIEQYFQFVVPNLYVTANAGSDTQTRSFGGRCLCQQGNLSVFLDSGMIGSGRRLAEEALELLAAPNCPSGKMDLLLMPSQMMLQIHESIGHPLELDRILGDERNFAGTSFVTLDMFGHYQYGSELLNVSFDPTLNEEFSTYCWDDDGSLAEKQFVIQDGLLARPLGGLISQARSGLSGVAASRACSWNRPPVDRIANLNIEPGASTLKEMVGTVERGVLMDTNTSWSIDDSRNKFQFGCEYGQLIENGELKGVIKNPNYRGISANFWRNLKAVGDRSTFKVMGTPFCGKAEPSQVIRVGHASPACLFENIEIFGGQD